MFYEYLCKAYRTFLDGADQFDDALSELSDNFARKNESIRARAGELDRAVKTLTLEVQKLRDAETPSQVQSANAELLDDIDKFTKFNQHLEHKRLKYVQAVQKQHEELSSLQDSISTREEKKRLLQVQVDAQKISPEDIDRMNAERDGLSRTLATLGQLKDETTRIIREKDAFCHECVEDIDKTLRSCSFAMQELAGRVGLKDFPAALQATVSFDPESAEIQPDAKGVLLPALIGLKDAIAGALRRCEERQLALGESCEQLGERINDKKEELRLAEDRLRRLAAQYMEEKEVRTYTVIDCRWRRPRTAPASRRRRAWRPSSSG